ncbi:MAG: DNA repair exonuclease [Clostridia bacterium]|nr:DNA repair exonuclease [Clostridia bacterium]
MKILHTSDIHIDSPLTARLARDKIKERRAELLSNLSRLAAECRRLGAPVMIIAGDLFDSDNVSRRALRTFYDIILEYSEIHFVVLPGNHDSEILSTEGFCDANNLHVFERGAITTFALGNVTFTGICPTRPGMLDELELDENSKNILILHGELRDKTVDDGESIGMRELVGKNIDYVALGHYHTYTVHELDRRTTAVYSGTPEGRGFDECGECGYVVIDTDGEHVSHSFVKFAKRNMRIVPVALDGVERPYDIIERTEAALENVPSSDLVRVELCGSYAPGLWKDAGQICERFRDRFYHFEVKDCSHISVRPEDYKYDKTLKGEFIRLVYADESLSEETKRRVVECGVFALMGEE